MNSRKRILIIATLLLLVLAIPATALASKSIYKARLTTSSELHDVIGSSASGSAVFGRTANGLRFTMYVHNLSGPVTGAHIHGPATEAENGPVIVSLCGAPAPAAFAECTMIDASTLRLDGELTSNLFAQWGVTASTFQSWLNDGLLYVNVHTELNPAGEVRGQIY